jgi:hypothetical protein
MRSEEYRRLKLWEDMAPTEKLAAIRELAEQLKALGDDRALRHEAQMRRSQFSCDQVLAHGWVIRFC